MKKCLILILFMSLVNIVKSREGGVTPSGKSVSFFGKKIPRYCWKYIHSHWWNCKNDPKKCFMPIFLHCHYCKGPWSQRWKCCRCCALIGSRPKGCPWRPLQLEAKG